MRHGEHMLTTVTSAAKWEAHGNKHCDLKLHYLQHSDYVAGDTSRYLSLISLSLSRHD